MHDSREEPAPDLLAVRADDALLDALGGSDPKVADELGQAELNELLLSWSREVDSEPMPQLVDTDTAIATIKTAKARYPGSKERRRRLLVPVAAAAAVLGVTFGGASIAARDAQPGDTLWGLTQVLYADKAASVEASYDVRAEFKKARDAMDDGDLDMARDALDKAENSLNEVADEEGHDSLQQQHDDLSDQLDAGGGDPDGGDSGWPDPGEDSSTPDSSSSTTTTPNPSSGTSSPPSTSSSEPPTSSSPTSSSTSGSTTDEGSKTSDGLNGATAEDPMAPAQPAQEPAG